jgi:dihydrofolate reductase
MNNLPKYVISTTLGRGDWNNTTVLKGNLPDEVRRLKDHVDGDILIYGSGQLVRALQEHDFIDEYRLMLYPVVLGAGKRLFGERGHTLAGEARSRRCRQGTAAAGSAGDRPR